MVLIHLKNRGFIHNKPESLVIIATVQRFTDEEGRKLTSIFLIQDYVI